MWRQVSEKGQADIVQEEVMEELSAWKHFISLF